MSCPPLYVSARLRCPLPKRWHWQKLKQGIEINAFHWTYSFFFSVNFWRKCIDNVDTMVMFAVILFLYWKMYFSCLNWHHNNFVHLRYCACPIHMILLPFAENLMNSVRPLAENSEMKWGFSIKLKLFISVLRAMTC